MKITLLGDSIRQQYGPRVEDLLGDNFRVWQPAENCRFAKYTLRGLFDWAKDMEGSDIVHWNNGHWDICNLFDDGPFTSEQEYIDTMLRILDILQKKHKVIIFSTTTPVRSNNKYNSNEVICRYNDIISSILKERGVIINDLNALLSPDVDRYINESDTIHLTEDGIALCAKQVADYIKEAAKTIDENSSENTISKAGTESDGAPVLI